jgi:putative ABC transport system permease protein
MTTAMLKQHITSAIRNISKHKGFAALNVLGLALGLSVFLLIVFYVFDELGYDKYNVKADRIMRVSSDMKFGGATVHFAITAPAVGPAMKNNFPEIEDEVRLCLIAGMRFKKGNQEIQEDSAIYSDPSVFNIFTLPMIKGDAKTALTDPNDIVISEHAARKYFNTTDIIGQTLYSVNDSMVHKVTGVIKDIPRQSHFHFDFMLPMSALASKDDDNWTSLNFNTYILLRPGVDTRQVEAKLPAFFNNALATTHFDVKAFENGGNFYRIGLTPLTDIHLRSNRERELKVNGNMEYVYIFSIVAGFILLMACVNFINLSTARSSNRAREVGVRKALGSRRIALIIQFLAESLILTLMAVVVAIFLAWLLLPVFNSLSGKDLTITLHALPWLLPTVFLSVIVVGIVAGAYPAFFLSGFQPVDVLKGKISRGFKGGGLRSFLVVFQFSLSIFLIISTLVVFNQMHYIENKDLGFDRTHVLLVKNVDHLNSPRLLSEQLRGLAGVIDATESDFTPTGKLRASRTISISEPKRTSVFTEFWPVDEDYLTTMGMQLVRGRNFSSRFPTDSSGMIVNEAAARMLGIYDRSLDEGITVYNDDHDDKPYHILAIVKDFNFNSLRSNVTPVVFALRNDEGSVMAVRVQSANLTGLLDQIRTKWSGLDSHEQFQYSFMDEDFDAIYREEQSMGRLFTAFSILAVSIACLGLLGLAAYASDQRTREMSIRKVLGADPLTLLALLVKEFLRLVMIAIAVAIPAGWWAMQHWLQGFSYRQNVTWGVLFYPAIGAIVIAVLAIGSQSIRAAMVNPAESLRSE